MQSSPPRQQAKRNLGETSVKRRKRNEDPMQAYDQLPRDLRRWIQTAKLPWSPASCRRVWLKTKARGDSLEQTLASLDRAEAATLARSDRLNGV